jgi:hypothetical protein
MQKKIINKKFKSKKKVNENKIAFQQKCMNKVEFIISGCMTINGTQSSKMIAYQKNRNETQFNGAGEAYGPRRLAMCSEVENPLQFRHHGARERKR